MEEIFGKRYKTAGAKDLSLGRMPFPHPEQLIASEAPQLRQNLCVSPVALWQRGHFMAVLHGTRWR